VQAAAPQSAPLSVAGAPPSPSRLPGSVPGGTPSAPTPFGPTHFPVAVEPTSAEVPVAVAVGLGVGGLATGFVVALAVLGRLGGRARGAATGS